MTIFPNFCKKKSRITYKRRNRKCTLIYGGIRSEESVWPKADWRAASLAEGRLARGLVDSRLMDFEFRDIQKPTDKVSFDVARLRVYRKSEVIVS